MRLYRRGLSGLGFYRFFRGGRISDLGRLPRYALIFGLGVGAIWVPITAYLVLSPKKFTSEETLILPGTGVSTSVNLSEIGQATTSANSAYASTSLSPSVTYKNLLESDAVIHDAAALAHVNPGAFGKPVVKLVDETSLIHFAVTGASPKQARERSLAVQNAFLSELDQLREDEIKQRGISASTTIKNYQAQVVAIRAQINALELQSGLTSADQYGAIVGSAEALQIQVAETQAALSEKDGSVNSLAKLLNLSPQAAALTLKVQADEETGALTEATAKAAANTAEMEKAFGQNHPKYLDARAKEQGLRSRLTARVMALSGLSPEKMRADIDSAPRGERPALLGRLVSTVVEREGLAAQLKTRQAELATRRKRIHDLVDVGSRLDALNRDYKIADAVFASALARLNTSKADIFASYPMVQVLEPASLPRSPSAPSLMISLAAGVGASMLLAISLGMTWLRRPLIDKIIAKGKSDLEADDAAEA
jgi:uncharacterized protein involved in exopolysaccharide biosynthesis